MQPVQLLISRNGSGAPFTSTRFGPDQLIERLQLTRNVRSLEVVTERCSGSKLEALAGLVENHQQICYWSHDAVENNRYPIVIGGDHSCAIGTWSGVAKASHQGIGMLWLDAHMDAHTPKTSESHQIHGMPLAALLGEGFQDLVAIGGRFQKIDPHRTVLFGVRSFEWPEFHFLNNRQVRVYTALEIAERGFEVCWQEAVRRVSPQAFGVSLDWDVFDPEHFPAVGSPVPQGLTPGMVLPALQRLLNHENCQGFEAVEYNPDFDREKKSLRIASHFLQQLLRVKATTSTASFLASPSAIEQVYL